MTTYNHAYKHIASALVDPFKFLMSALMEKTPPFQTQIVGQLRRL